MGSQLSGLLTNTYLNHLVNTHLLFLKTLI